MINYEDISKEFRFKVKLNFNKEIIFSFRIHGFCQIKLFDKLF